MPYSDYYVCFGSVRGQCAVQHRTEATAQAHVEEDQRKVARANWSGSLTKAYSDRQVYRIPAGMAESDILPRS
jgi:hypothetical protein